MKIFFGFPNPDSIHKLAPALQALDINLLKAEPANVPLRGLHRIPQDGYAEYSSHLPAFMYATEMKKSVPISREGFPVITKAEDVIDLAMPSVFVSFKGARDISAATKNTFDVKPISVREKNMKAYTIDYQSGLLGHLRSSDFDKAAFPIANTVSAADLASLITILRILSAFLRTHKYPAFPTQTDFELEYSTYFDTHKRQLTNKDEYQVDDQGNPTKRMALTTEDGEPTWARPFLGEQGATVTFRRAKPVDSDLPPWGDVDSIPVTDGIVFPYVEELAVWDKSTVCDAIGLHFMRCLGHTTDGCLKMYSDLCQHWKRSIHRTPIGNVLSHIFKVVLIAIPAQARVFPVITKQRYTGCYLSGSGYSVALRSELFRPSDFANNREDFDCFDGIDALLMKILAVCTTDTKKKEVVEKIRKMASGSMRGLDAYLNTWILTIDKIEQVRSLAARIKYPQEYWRINMESIQQVITWLKDGDDPSKDTPMHAHGLQKKDRLVSCLSVFGPSAPSPTIPGSQKLPVTAKAPPNFNKVLAFRTTSLETAVADWKEFGDKGFVYNGPERLSGRYQYVQVRGEDERDKWFSVMNGYHVWYKAEQRKDLTGEAGNVDLDALEGVVLGTEDLGVDMTGF